MAMFGDSCRNVLVGHQEGCYCFWHIWSYLSVSRVQDRFFSNTRLALLESPDRMFFNWWVWLESHTYLASFPGRLPLHFLDRIRDLVQRLRMRSRKQSGRRPGNEANTYLLTMAKLPLEAA